MHKINDMVAEAARLDAAQRRETAGQSGSWNDGGAREIEGQVAAWEAGLRGEVPDSLSRYLDVVKDKLAVARAERDPEYADYVRLKAKFAHLPEDH